MLTPSLVRTRADIDAVADVRSRYPQHLAAKAILAREVTATFAFDDVLRDKALSASGACIIALSKVILMPIPCVPP